MPRGSPVTGTQLGSDAKGATGDRYHIIENSSWRHGQSLYNWRGIQRVNDPIL